MRLFDVEQEAQDLVDDRPVMDTGDVGERIGAENITAFRKKKPQFTDFK